MHAERTESKSKHKRIVDLNKASDGVWFHQRAIPHLAKVDDLGDGRIVRGPSLRVPEKQQQRVSIEVCVTDFQVSAYSKTIFNTSYRILIIR